MAEKVETLRRLLRDGYVVDEIASDRGSVEATLRKGPAVVKLRLLPSDAEALLLDPRPLH